MNDRSTEALLARRALAEKATPGPWKKKRRRFFAESEEVPYVVAGIVILFAMRNGECQADHNADFCAANDPPTVIEDIDEILRLRAEVARLEKESDYLATRLSIMVDRLIALKAARMAVEEKHDE